MDAKKPISVQALRTSVFSVNDNIVEFILQNTKGYELEGKVLCITSKIISLSEKRLVPKDSIEKLDLIKREADIYLGPAAYGCELTIKHGILIPSAGIDESNSALDHYILFPENPFLSAKNIWIQLRQKLGVKNIGVILTDSHTMPLRRGVTGISLAHWGIKATESLIGQPDIFGRELKFTHVDVVDALASMAVFAMGEANDCTPLALITNARIEFCETSAAADIAIEPKNDLYYPLLKDLIKTNE